MKEISQRIVRDEGSALIIDYGYTTDLYGDTLQALHQHRFADILENIGNQDLTSHVNFHTLKKIAHENQLNTALTTQGKFLRALGIDLRIQQLLKSATLTQKNELLSGTKRLISVDGMGELFKVLAVSSAHLPPPIGF